MGHCHAITRHIWQLSSTFTWILWLKLLTQHLTKKCNFYRHILFLVIISDWSLQISGKCAHNFPSVGWALRFSSASMIWCLVFRSKRLTRVSSPVKIRSKRRHFAHAVFWEGGLWCSMRYAYALQAVVPKYLKSFTNEQFSEWFHMQNPCLPVVGLPIRRYYRSCRGKSASRFIQISLQS